MPVHQIFDTRDAAPEFLRPALIEQDGKFAFIAELPHEVRGLKTALDEERSARKDERAEREKLREQLKQFEGLDLEKVRQVEAERAEREAKDAQSKGDWTAREAQLKSQLAADLQKREAQYTSEITTRDELIQRLQSALEKSLVESQAASDIAAAKGEPALLLPHVLRQTRVIEEGGEYRVQVLDAHGQPRIADIKGAPFTIRHLIAEMKEDPIFGRAFEASGNGGSGAPPMQTGSGARNQDWMSLSPTERLNAARQAGIKQ